MAKGQFLKALATSVVGLNYDFGRQIGRLEMPDGCCCDMAGCITLFWHIDPQVRRIDTFAGNQHDTTYWHGKGRWRGVRYPRKEAPTLSLSEQFHVWLAQASITDDPAGDFIQDARCDRDLPPVLTGVQTLHRHLDRKNACNEAHDALSQAWRRFGFWRKRQRKREHPTKLNTVPKLIFHDDDPTPGAA